MSRSRLVPLAAFSLLALTAAGAHASPLISATNSTAPTLIHLVGSTAGVPDAATGEFTIVGRGLTNIPAAGASIVIDLSNCADLALCADEMDANALVNCAAKTVLKIANAQGEVTFTLLGHSNGTGHATSPAGAGRIFGNGVLMRTPTIASFDLDGTSGVGAGDLSTWLADFGSGQAFGRSDFDGNGGIDANDLSLWLEVFGAGTSATSCASSCP